MSTGTMSYTPYMVYAGEAQVIERSDAPLADLLVYWKPSLLPSYSQAAGCAQTGQNMADFEQNARNPKSASPSSTTLTNALSVSPTPVRESMTRSTRMRTVLKSVSLFPMISLPNSY